MNARLEESLPPKMPRLRLLGQQVDLDPPEALGTTEPSASGLFRAPSGYELE
jgi:hypothetical protein